MKIELSDFVVKNDGLFITRYWKTKDPIMTKLGKIEVTLILREYEENDIPDNEMLKLCNFFFKELELFQSFAADYIFNSFKRMSPEYLHYTKIPEDSIKEDVFDFIEADDFELTVYKNNTSVSSFKKLPYYLVFSFSLPWLPMVNDNEFVNVFYLNGKISYDINSFDSNNSPLEIIESTLEDCELSSEFDTIKPFIKPSLSIDFSDKKSAKSYFGGTPRLKAGTQWPEHKFGPYRFLGFIDFAELKVKSDLLLEDGVLNLFVADDPEGRIFWGDDEYIKGIYYPKSEKLRVSKSPKPVEKAEKYQIEFTESLDLPPGVIHEFEFGEENEASEILHELRCDLNESGHHMLGYPTCNTLAYDPTPGKEWIHFLTLNSDSDLEWCWHDGDHLMIFIEKEKLKNKDFSNLKSDAG